MVKISRDKVFYGSTTLGEKGQVVIPADARKSMHIKTGEKMLVFGMHSDMLVMAKISNLEKIASHISGELKGIKDIIRKNK